jgi:hypothetical protein
VDNSAIDRSWVKVRGPRTYDRAQRAQGRELNEPIGREAKGLKTVEKRGQSLGQ